MSSAAKPNRLSVAMIVRDAEQALGQTLASVSSIADEIVVLDTGSQDESRSTAENAGARVISRPWQDDFSAARNDCLSHVNGDWVLWLDAGEQLSPEDAAELRSFVESSADESKAYAMVIQVPPRTPREAHEQVARIRLVPNRSGIGFEGRVRESLLASLAAAGMEIEGLPYRIKRDEREHDPRSKQEKARRNVRLADRAIKEVGPLPNLLNCLGDAFQTLEDLDRSRQFFHHALNGAERGSVEMLEAYYGLLTSMDNDVSNREEQLQLAVQASDVFPLDAQLLVAMGGYLQALGQTELAEKSYQTAFRYGQINAQVWHVAEVRDIAAICLSITLQLQNKLDPAREVLVEAVTENGQSIRLRRHLIEVYIKSGMRDEALEQVDALPPQTPRRESLRSAVRGACLAAQQNWLAAKAYLKTAFVAGCEETFCFRWLTVCLLSLGESDEAQEVLERWQSLEPGNEEPAKYLESLGGAPAGSAQSQPSVDSPPPASVDSPVAPSAGVASDARKWRVDSPESNPKTSPPPSSSPSTSHRGQPDATPNRG